jgi:hypothetical protein
MGKDAKKILKLISDLETETIARVEEGSELN